MKVQRAETKVQDAKKATEAAEQEDGLLSARALMAAAQVEGAIKERDIAKAEELAVFDLEWFPTLWRTYTVFGPTLDNPHGHAGFLSLQNGACVTSGQLPDGAGHTRPADGRTPCSSRKRVREEDAQTKSEGSPSIPSSSSSGERSTGEAQSDPGSDTNVRLMSALERSLELSQERMRRDEERAKMANVDRQIINIKAMLEESGDLMEEHERNDLRKQLLELRRKNLAMATKGGF
jgi:hypothetical protein